MIFTNILSSISEHLSSAILLIAICYVVVFSQTKKIKFLHYSLYLLFISLCFWTSIYSKNEILSSKWFFSLQYLAFYFYMQFIRDLLQTKIKAPQWDTKMVFFSRVFLFLVFLFLVIYWVFGLETQPRLNLILAPIFTVFALLSYIVFAKIRDKIIPYFITGSLLFVIFANISLLVSISFKEILESKFGLPPIIFMQVGVVLEIVCFAFVVGIEMQENEEQQEITAKLLALKNKEKTSLKMTALQSQMDPHFLYNSLNSINNFVLQNNAEKASDYITKFSRLIREILNNSENVTITLKKELGILGLYVKLEQMRLQEGFDYILEINESLALEKINVPPLFLQPFVENAIWHGIANKKGEKQIKLQIFEEGDFIRIELVDNGIGIHKTMHDKSYLKSNKKSFGIKATEDRIKLLHENAKVYLVIEDLSDGTDKTGTKVTIKFPKS